MRLELVRAVGLAVIGATIVAVLLIAVPLVLQAIAQPNIVLTETSVPERRLCAFPFTFFFTIVNTGDADGLVIVEFLLDDEPRANQSYFVPAGSSVEKTFDLDPNDGCLTHTASLRIASFWKP